MYDVISADNHINEAPNLFVDHLPDEFKDRAPRIVRGEDGGDGWSFDGQPPRRTFGLDAVAGRPFEQYKSSGLTLEEILPGNYDGAAHLQDLDADGIDAAVIFPAVSLSSYIQPDRRFGVAMLEAYNDWLFGGFCSADPNRLLGLALLPVDDGMDMILAELERVQEKGARGIFLPYYAKAPYHDRFYDPLWRELSAAGLPAVIHRTMGGAAPATDDTPSPQDAAGLNIAGIVERFFTAVAPFSRLVFSGLFERFPDLKFVDAEVNGGWVPFWIQMMEQEYERQRHWANPPLHTAPGEFLGTNLFVTILDDEVAFKLAQDHDGLAKAAMFSTDYPHSATLFPNTQRYISDLTAGMDEQRRHDILAGNAVRVFNL